MNLNQTKQRIQNNLGDYCRTGQLKDIPGLTPNRVHHYRRLVYNVIDSTLEQAFPLTYQLVDQDVWNNWVNRFFSSARPQSPQLFNISYDFYEWSVENEMLLELHMPYLNDLMLFEWVEIEVHTMPDVPVPSHHKQGDLFKDVLLLNPEYRIINIEYPVHLKPASDLEANKGNFFVLVFREPQYGRVEFIDMSVFYVYLLDRIINAGESLADYLPQAVQKFEIDQALDINQAVTQFFNDLKEKGFVLGYRS